MDTKQLINKFICSRWIIPVSILFALLMRLLSGASYSDFTIWIVAGIQIAIALILLQINHTFTIIRVRTMLPAYLYLLFTASDPTHYNELSANAIALCLVACLFFLFQSYQKENAQADAFNISFILTIGSLFFSPLLFIFPLFWYGFYRLRFLTVKVFLSSIMGIMIVYLFVVAWSLYKNDFGIFFDKLPQIKDIALFLNIKLTAQEWVSTGLLIILTLVARISNLIYRFSEKIRTSIFLQFLYAMVIYVFLLFFLLNEWHDEWISIVYIPVSLVLSHYFTLSNSKFSYYLFFTCIFFYLSIFAWEATI